MKERLMSGFNVSKAVILMSRTSISNINFFEDSELEVLLAEDSCETEEELAESLGMTQQAISKRLKVMEMIQKQVNWVPYEFEA